MAPVYAGAWSRGAGASTTVQHLAPDGHGLWAGGPVGGLSAPLLIGPGDTAYAVGDYDGIGTRCTPCRRKAAWPGARPSSPPWSRTRGRRWWYCFRDGTLAVVARRPSFFFARRSTARPAGAGAGRRRAGRQRAAVGARGSGGIATRASGADSGQARWLERWRYGAARIAEEEHLPVRCGGARMAAAPSSPPRGASWYSASPTGIRWRSTCRRSSAGGDRAGPAGTCVSVCAGRRP